MFYTKFLCVKPLLRYNPYKQVCLSHELKVISEIQEKNNIHLVLDTF
jgi:hypothetical protein